MARQTQNASQVSPTPVPEPVTAVEVLAAPRAVPQDEERQPRRPQEAGGPEPADRPARFEPQETRHAVPISSAQRPIPSRLNQVTTPADTRAQHFQASRGMMLWTPILRGSGAGAFRRRRGSWRWGGSMRRRTTDVRSPPPPRGASRRRRRSRRSRDPANPFAIPHPWETRNPGEMGSFPVGSNAHGAHYPFRPAGGLAVHRPTPSGR